MQCNDSFRYILKEGSGALDFESARGVFRPTDTSGILIEACRRHVTSPKKTLDLGCGCGIVGIVLATMGLCKGPLFASDLSDKAVELTRKNACRMSVECVARCGSLFEPWKGDKFDLIVDDVAGISDDIAAISPWYADGVSCGAGRGGAKWIVQVVEQSARHLTEGGVLIFPVLSLSDEEKILRAVKTSFRSYEIIAKKDWFLPDAMAARQDVLVPLIADGSIKCQKKYGKWIWYTHIYKACI